MKTLLSCIVLCMIAVNFGFAGDGEDDRDEKLVIHLPGRRKAELSPDSEKVGRIARAVLVGLWDKDRLEDLSSLRITPVTTPMFHKREVVRIRSKDFTVDVDVETGCLMSYRDDSQGLEPRGIPDDRLDEAIAYVRAMDIPRLFGWTDFGIEFSYELACTRLSNIGLILFPRMHDGHEFLDEQFSVSIGETTAGLEIFMIGTNTSFMQPAPSSIKITAEEAKKYFAENILETPYISRQIAAMKESQNLQIVEGSIRVLDEKPLYMHKNEFLETGEIVPIPGEIRLIYRCAVRLSGKRTTYEIEGYVDAENMTLIGGFDNLRIDR